MVSTLKVVLIPGLLGIPRRESFRMIQIRPESKELAQQRADEGLIRGIAMEKSLGVLLVEFSPHINSLRTSVGVVWRKADGEMVIVHFAKCYLNRISSWQMATLAKELDERCGVNHTSSSVLVYNVEPVIPGGNWEDLSPARDGWIKFRPFLKPMVQEITKPEKINEVSNTVFNHLRDSGMSELFIQELIALRAKRINNQRTAWQKGA